MIATGMPTTALLLLVASAAHGQITFEITKGPGLLALETSDPTLAASMYSKALYAGSIWSSKLFDPITVKFKLDYSPTLGAIGSTSGTSSEYTYMSVKGAMMADATSPEDFTSIGALQPGPTMTMRVNDTTMAVPPPFPGFLPYIDSDTSPNNTHMWVSKANAKALGLISPHSGAAGSDGTITVGPSTFDFEHSDGIMPGMKDYTGMILHEMAHLLGFTSGADYIGGLLPPPLGGIGGDQDDYWLVNTLDLFRYSPISATAGPFVFDISVPVPSPTDVPMRFFSIDGGMTPLAPFSTGTVLGGDGKQASHWKDDFFGPWWGLMDPTLGDAFPLTSMFLASAAGLPFDLIALDVIGYDLVPAPGAMALIAYGGLVASRRRRAA
ncbi:MAG: hypothetical protein HBSAPP03_11090 [Phycisphaerae bacterium]|nr:MAG: hypothetical protein HBSAPP03_11090 [Phycisphaerae bacterium]